MTASSLAQIVGLLEQRYPPSLAEAWDAVGLVCGDPQQPVAKVLFAVDPHPDVVAEATQWEADLLLVHHPLLLQAVHSVAADTPKGRVLHGLVRSGCALYTAHTNADAAEGGVNDALATTLGLVNTQPLASGTGGPYDKVVTYVPPDAAEAVGSAMADAGAGTIGEYTRCTWRVVGDGSFLPGARARPLIGEPGVLERTREARLEMRLPRALRQQVLTALVRAHPYEEVAYDVYELAEARHDVGMGRVGDLAEPTTVGAFAERIRDRLPRTPLGVRVSGDPARAVGRVAVCGGAGDRLVQAAAAAGADVFVTSDLRHHPALENLVDGGPALVDAGHFATEWPWLPVAAQRLAADAREHGTTVEVRVSSLVTDPWTAAAPSSSKEQL